MSMVSACVLIAVILTCDCLATVLRVPSDFETIQSAVGSVQAGDTVLVALGVYSEAVECPQISFSFIGELQLDSSGSHRPIIDPSLLPQSQTLSCLHLRGPSMVVKNFVFRNGPQMFPHDPLFEGGVIVEQSNNVFNNCVFDSTNTGIRAENTLPLLTIELCEFLDCQNYPLAVERTRVLAAACFINLRGISCGQGSEFRDCTFDSITGSALNTSGTLLLERCLFQNLPGPGLPTIDASNLSGRIAGCWFIHCTPSTGVVVAVRNCDQELAIENNLFSDIDPNAMSASPVSWGCLEGTSGGSVIIRGNTFTNCIGEQGARCIRCTDSSAVEIDSNRFIENFGNSAAVSIAGNHNSVTLRKNVFVGNGFALSSNHVADARQNYWGDSTGPYHPALNPDGLGDRVSDSVVFEPWYPDTSFLIDAVGERVELPTEFTFSIFPNPFNSEARLLLTVPEPFIASIELMNVLGQRVREIHRGPVYGRESFPIEANQLPSGIYFVNVRDVVRNSVTASQKIALIR